MTANATVRMDLPVAPEAVATARDAMYRFAGKVNEETVETLRLLVSELVTNAYRHARLGPGDRIELRGRVRGRSVRLEVEDTGEGFAPPDTPAPRGESGWGLYLVDHLADRWGVDRGRQNRVWVEIDENPTLEEEGPHGRSA